MASATDLSFSGSSVSGIVIEEGSGKRACTSTYFTVQNEDHYSCGRTALEF
jgi:hypothetical protein